MPTEHGPRATVLVVEDDESLLRIAHYELARAGHEVVTARNGDEGLARFVELEPDAVVTDVRMPGRDGNSLLREVLARRPDLPLIVMTGHGSVRDAVVAMRAGATDYLTKPVDWDEVVLVLERALERQALVRDNRRLRAALGEGLDRAGMLGESPPMRAVFAALARLAQSDATVLVLGESGTGKELVTRSLHLSGPRAAEPLVTLNCGALPRDLVGSQLFGHERGAFTGAASRHRGVFEEASGGTLFLDEVGEIPLEQQPVLLRVLEERAVRRVGGDRSIPVDVRVVAATNRDLERAVEDGDFRGDLYYRLAVVPLELPPLRARRGDVALLARHFVDQLYGAEVALAPDAMAALEAHPWPGNVRQLRNALERALLLRMDPSVIQRADLPDGVRSVESPLGRLLAGDFPAGGVDLAELERRCLEGALAQADGNQSQAARLLGISRQTLIYRMGKHGL